MSGTPVVLAHGLEGSPYGRKASALTTAGVQLICPDCRGLNLAERVKKLEPYVEPLEKMILVGSSYGGLVALWLAQQFPERTLGVVLCAPALHRSEPPLHGNTSLPSTIPGHIIHGVNDRIVPVTISHEFKRTHPHVTLEVVNDDHSLRESTQRLVEAVRRLLS